MDAAHRAPTAEVSRTCGARWLRSEDAGWADLLATAGPHDVYHLPGGHRVAEASGWGEAWLNVAGDDRGSIALPLLLRPIEGAPGCCDATSVQGYAGPITSAVTVDPDLVARFHQTLRQGLVERGAIALFARLHPLLEQPPLLAGMGELERLGDSVSIDLRQPVEATLAAYRSNHRRDLASFGALYHENMRRVQAKPQYFLDSAYFDRLAGALGPALALASCHQDGELVGGGLFMRHGPFAQHHPGAVCNRHAAAAPAKQLIDTTRRHFHAAGAEVLHLGGGRGAAEDSLFHFKAGFSPRRHPFTVWRWIIDADAYGMPVAGRPATDFFPAYRG